MLNNIKINFDSTCYIYSIDLYYIQYYILRLHNFLMYSVKPVILCVVALFNIIKGVLLMTMGN